MNLKRGNLTLSIILVVATILIIGLESYFAWRVLTQSLSRKPNENISNVSLEGSKLLPYRDSQIGISFLYPEAWPISTIKEFRDANPSLIDSFSSQNELDRFFEGFSVFAEDVGVDFVKFVDNAR